ncbi:MAG TPA: hypothetical protein PLS69_10710, partial [Terricaulis sp.]|nr:hypothetical protein [Terricaulis sp.]
MTRPRKGRRVAFAKDDTAPSQDDKIAGLRFTIEPAHGGSVVLDFVDLKPRRLALAFAKTLRS